MSVPPNRSLVAPAACVADRVNEWNGFRRIELEVIDLKPGGTAALG